MDINGKQNSKTYRKKRKSLWPRTRQKVVRLDTIGIIQKKEKLINLISSKLKSFALQKTLLRR